MAKVVATAVGFDGRQMRQPGEEFDAPVGRALSADGKTRTGEPKPILKSSWYEQKVYTEKEVKAAAKDGIDLT